VKLPEVNAGVVDRAVELYLELAYGAAAAPGRVPDTGTGEALGRFQREQVGDDRVRYAMRLGNRNYPFMKLVLQEHLVPGEFYFAVDTHDEMDIKPEYPDYAQFMAVRRFNRSLKLAIEARFLQEGLPTAASLHGLCVDRASGAVGTLEGSILVVDDEEDLARGVEVLLRARGYRVRSTHDGAAGIRLAREERPDLILLDYELPEMDGLEVIDALRADPALAGIPVLLTTASRISLDDVARADGFLAKPFQADLLYEVVQRLLRPSVARTPDDDGGARGSKRRP
jgi:two-component system chemotaxis response regulator CheY